METKINIKDAKNEEVSFGKTFLSSISIVLASAMFAFNLNALLTPGGLIPGGFSGITVLLQYISQEFLNYDLPFSLVYLPLNLVPVIIAFKYIGKRFTLLSLFGIIMQSVLADLIPEINFIDDMLLIAVFGGLIGGISISLMLYMGACSGGLDFISIYFAEKKGINTWNYVLCFNAILLIILGIVFGYDYALYSIIYQFVQTQVLNFMDRRLQKDTILVVTTKPEAVSTVINNLTLHASTIIDATGGYSGEDKKLVYSVIGRNEATKLMVEIRKVDSDAFVNVLRTDRLSGNFYMRPR